MQIFRLELQNNHAAEFDLVAQGSASPLVFPRHLWWRFDVLLSFVHLPIFEPWNYQNCKMPVDRYRFRIGLQQQPICTLRAIGRF